MQRTNINWTGFTWNPASGCRRVSPGCRYCYAETLAERRRGTRAFPVGFDPMMRPHKLGEPERIAEPSLVFVNSMSDLYIDDFPDSFIDQVLEVVRRCHWHRFQILTKRPERMRDYFKTRTVPSNAWLGTTIEGPLYVERADVLREIDAPVRFLSIEPFLRPFDGALSSDGIAWGITGGESGSHLSDPKVCEQRALVRSGRRREGEPLWVAREDRIPWVREVRDLFAASGTAFWHKQWGGPIPKSGGRLLDGVEHNGMPHHVAGAMPPTSPQTGQRSLPILQG